MCGTSTCAVCIGLGVCGGQTVGDVTFTNDDTPDGFTIVAQSLLTMWGAASCFGDSDDDAALIELHASIRWSAAGNFLNRCHGHYPGNIVPSAYVFPGEVSEGCLCSWLRCHC